jgi:hypothetical protein
MRLGFAGADDIYNLNPPTMALLFWPLAVLPPYEAKAVWTGLNLLLLGLALGGVIHTIRGGPLEAAAGIVLIAVFQPIREDLRLGQVYVLLLAIAVVVLWSYVEGRALWTGLGIGLLLGLKTAGVGLLVLLVSQRRWRALVWTGGTLAVLSGASALVLGVGPWARYLTFLSRFRTHPELAVTAYQDLPGFYLHLFSRDATWNASPLFAVPWLGALLAGGSALALLGLTLRWTERLDPSSRGGRALAFAAWATLDLVLSPVSEDYHYVLALAPIGIVLANWLDGRPGRAGLAILAIAIGLIGAPLPYKAPSLAVGGWAILAYPKLYGALLLWSLVSTALRREGRARREVGGLGPSSLVALEGA